MISNDEIQLLASCIDPKDKEKHNFDPSGGHVKIIADFTVTLLP
jgi:hypothetical protein